MKTHRQHHGFSLLEVLVAMLIIAVGLLGISAVQMRASQAEMESYQRAQALLLVDDMVNRMRANAIFIACYELDRFNISFLGTKSTFVDTGCNTVSDQDLAAWHGLLLGAAETLGDDNVGAMLNARGCITYDAVNDTFTVTAAWQGLSETVAPTGNACGAGQYGLETRRRVASVTFRVGSLIGG